MRSPTISSASLLAFQGRLDEAIAEGKRAAELDPLSPQIPVDALIAFAWQGKFQEARELARRAADLDPTYFFPPFMEGWIEIQAGRSRTPFRNSRKPGRWGRRRS